MNAVPGIYRETLPDQTNPQIWKDISLNTGATQSTLQEIKVAERAGGYCYKNVNGKIHNRNRWIYWRTCHDTLELCEISLDLNLVNGNVRYKFADSPVLSVAIFEIKDFIIILVATVSTLHRLNFMHPDRLQKRNTVDIQSHSIFHDATPNSVRDPSTFYVIGHIPSANNNPIPHTAACWLQSNGDEALFCLAYQTTLMLFTMNCNSAQTIAVELKQHYIIPRIFSNIAGALRGKTNSTDNQYVTSICFNAIDGQTFLYALYRDDHIRMWSTKTNQCVADVNCLQDGTLARPQGPQTNALRHGGSPTTICAFLCHSLGAEFITIESINNSKDVNTNNINNNNNNNPSSSTSSSSSSFVMQRVNVIQAPKYDLVDFEITNNSIWGLWCNSDGEFHVSSYVLNPLEMNLNWVEAALVSPPDRGIGGDIHGNDPRAVYCACTFHPGKFQRNVIAKALVMFRRSNVTYDPNVSLAMLKDRVCQAIDTEIQYEINDFDVTDEEYNEISTKFWKRFYSCCEQYQVKATQPIGFVALSEMNGLCIVKKNAFSLLRPCEPLEQMMLASTNEEFIEIALASIHEQKYQDMVKLISILSQIEHSLPNELKTLINGHLYELISPNLIISQFHKDVMATGQFGNISSSPNFRLKLRLINDLPAAMLLLLDALRLDQGEPEAMHTHSEVAINSRLLLSIGHLFCSDFGVSIINETVRQITWIRFALCRNLLILQYLLMESIDLNGTNLELIRSKCMPDTVVFIQAYFVMVWMTENVSELHTKNIISAQSLNLLNLQDPVYNLQKSNDHQASLLELFLRGKGSYTGLQLFVEGSYCGPGDIQWHSTLLPFVTIIGQLIWPVSGNFVFGEWLMRTGQHVLIQEYVRLLSHWCEWNTCSRNFIAAISFLDNGESHKAYDLFMKSSKGVVAEPFLERIIQKDNEMGKVNGGLDGVVDEGGAAAAAAAAALHQYEVTTQYYLKIIQLFEQHSTLDYVILLAKAAIDILRKDDPKLAMYQSIVFTNQLNLEHYIEAYHALIEITEGARRKDCLRELVTTLFQKKRLDVLISFPFVRLRDDLENILETRARSMAIEDNITYDFLYAFHIEKDSMRKASSIMYEKAMRYSLECRSVDAMQSRYNCLLACLNVLQLVDPKYAWIAKPIVKDDCDLVDDDDDDDRNDDNHDAQQMKTNNPLREKIKVLEINDIKMELLLTEAVLCLSKYHHELNSIINADARELMAILSNVGLYTAAIKLAKGFSHSIAAILENLTAACVRSHNENSNDVWMWLQKNDLASLPHRNEAETIAWKLLETILFEHESESVSSTSGSSETVLHKCVTNKILSLGEFVPNWLLQSYKRKNPTELLQLYVNNGHLIDGTALAKEYIWAMIKTGGEQQFGLRNTIQSTLPAMCFPANTIDLLLYGLEMNAAALVKKRNGITAAMNEDGNNNSNSNDYSECHQDLKEIVEHYIQISKSVSLNKIQYEFDKIEI